MAPKIDPAISELPMDIAPDVSAAIADGKPVVALESTIITHGMPFPENIEMAEAVETLVAENGSVPATIAVLDGRLKIGLSAEERRRLAECKDPLKLSRSDLAFAMIKNRTGGTTVAATMIAAALAGISVFATGGIGGVHRGAEKSFDISADLEELSRTPVVVVSAGPKAILDIEKTLEVLESKGVPVIGYGTDTLPAFWSRESRLAAPMRLDAPSDIATLFAMRRRLQLGGGMLIANPVPADSEIPSDQIDAHITEALGMADRQGITGKDVTPFLLDQMLQLTAGASLRTNIALVRNNARLAAEIAAEIASQEAV